MPTNAARAWLVTLKVNKIAKVKNENGRMEISFRPFKLRLIIVIKANAAEFPLTFP